MVNTLDIFKIENVIKIPLPTKKNDQVTIKNITFSCDLLKITFWIFPTARWTTCSRTEQKWLKNEKKACDLYHTFIFTFFIWYYLDILIVNFSFCSDNTNPLVNYIYIISLAKQNILFIPWTFSNCWQSIPWDSSYKGGIRKRRWWDRLSQRRGREGFSVLGGCSGLFDRRRGTGRIAARWAGRGGARGLGIGGARRTREGGAMRTRRGSAGRARRGSTGRVRRGSTGRTRRGTTWRTRKGGTRRTRWVWSWWYWFLSL